MDKSLINNASFSKICKILKSKKSVWEDVKPILQAMMLIIPALVSKEFATTMVLHEILEKGIMWIETSGKIGKAVSSINNLVNKPEEDFITRAENAQIANALLIFSSYFDTVKIFLPDKEGNIFLDEVQYCLTEKSLKAYQDKLQANESASMEADGRKIADWELVLPNPLEGLDEYEKRLKEFYMVLNGSFRVYLDGLSCTEELQEHLRGELNRRLERIPETAICNYRKQYYSLAAICPDFFVWSNQQEHQQQRALVDRGFQSLAEQIHSIPEAINEYTVNEALTALKNHYSNHLCDPIIDIKDMPTQDQSMKMPTRENSFVPQDYEWLIYRERISVEATRAWKDGRTIGPDILNILRSPELGNKPVLILGDPGAGKTMLCHMLAGKILCGEYHVIVLHLRDLNAELSIADQIGQAIARTIDDDGCKWGSIAKAKPKKPVLLIFDGYDELLQASGKTYSNYLEKIAEFQEKQWKTWEITVRSIVTSRIVLIDKVEIPLNSVIIRLKQFDKTRINEWCEVWNRENEAYFEVNGLKKFEIGEDSNAWELAGEPLLLLMLALFDTKDNALRKHQNLQATELYASLIKDFVEREKKKDPEFEKKEANIRIKEIEKEMERIAVAAIGMFNRNALHITSGQLEDDLKLLSSVTTGKELRDSERLLGSFFFIHDLTTRSADIEEKEKLRAYTFLHNTFGEFLSAYYIVLQLYNLLDDLKRHVDKYEDAFFSMKDRVAWYASLSYAPLFQRPVVGKMVREWAPQYFRDKGLSEDVTITAIEELLNRETPRLLRGRVICEIETVAGKFKTDEGEAEIDLLKHLAIYTSNIMCIATLLTGGVDIDKIETMVAGAWDKLLHLWRYAFDENEIAAFAGQFRVKVCDERQWLMALDVTADIQNENDRITKLYKTYKNLREEPGRSILGILLGADCDDIGESLKHQGLRAEAKNILFGIVLEKAKKEASRIHYSSEHFKILKTYPDKCLIEGDYGALYTYFLVLNDIAAFSREGSRYVRSLVDFDLLVDVYVYCSRQRIITTTPILDLIDKLLPIINDRKCRNLIDRVASSYEFESCLSDSNMKLFANLLLQSMNRVEDSVWLDACWKLLRHADEWVLRKPNSYSCETIERLCLLSLAANRCDPGFPFYFFDAATHWIKQQTHKNRYSKVNLTIVELLGKHLQRMRGYDIYWYLERMLDLCDYEYGLSDDAIKVATNVLLKECSQVEVRSWLDICFRLLKSAEQSCFRNSNPYSDETIERLFELSIEASKKEPDSPLDFIYKYALWTARRTLAICDNRDKIRADVLLPFTILDLVVLITATDIMLARKPNFDEKVMQILEGTEAILRFMLLEGIKLSEAIKGKNQVVIALSHTVHLYSSEVRAYVLDELTELVRTIRMGISLELYRELNSVAERFNHYDLRYELTQMH